MQLRTEQQMVSRVDVLVFFAELAMLAGFAVAGARLGVGEPIGVVLAIAFPLAAAVVWGLWLAPRAARKLGRPGGLALKVLLVVLAAGSLAAGGAAVWAVALVVGACGSFVIGDTLRDG